MKKREYAQIVKKLDDSNFEILPHPKRVTSENIQILHNNLWSMFKMKFTKEQVEEFRSKNEQHVGMSISDYAWTEDVKYEFYNHPFQFLLFQIIIARTIIQ